jgi:hypothetical protein
LTYSFVERFINELDSVIPKNKEKLMVGSLAVRWIKPPRGLFEKINVDAAISKNLSMASVATVARDEDDIFLGASTLVLEGRTNAEIAEVVACREGLALASDVGLDPNFSGGQWLHQCSKEHPWTRFWESWPYHSGDQEQEGWIHKSGFHP